MLVKKKHTVIPARRSLWRKIALGVGVCTLVSVAGIFIGTRLLLHELTPTPIATTAPESASSPSVVENGPQPFPFGVDPERKTITENPAVDDFFGKNPHAQYLAERSRTGWLSQLLGKLALFDLYQNIASPTGRILVIQTGERKEEVANHFAKILGWDASEKERFLASVIESAPQMSEGKFLPGTYVTSRSATSSEVAALVNARFENDIGSRYTEEIEAVVPLAHTLTIASLIEREAYNFDDSRYISGVIWNRLFAGMNLQLDATLQYAKGTKSAATWWPRVVPSDKNIKSPFNTYAHEGLPPAPIANPSSDSVLAALNPRKTDCMYYFHDSEGGFHCSVTYEEHVTQLKKYYGRGK